MALLLVPAVVILLFVGIFDSPSGSGGGNGGGGGCSGPVSTCPPLAGNSVAATAQMIASHLVMCGGYDKCYSTMPSNVIQYWQTRCPIVANCYSDWQSGNLQCVLYVVGAYGVAGDPLPASGNAIDYWGLYAHRPGWSEIPNGSGPAQPGDLMVWNGPSSAGHIAIAIAVQANNLIFGEANGPSPLVYAKLNGNAVVNPIAGTFLGFIRHLTPPPGSGGGPGGPQPIASGAANFICTFASYAQLASSEIPTGSRGQAQPWYPSVILAQWGKEVGWHAPSVLTGYNLGNVGAILGYPSVNSGGIPGAPGAFAYGTTIQQGIAEYVATVQNGNYTAVAAAYAGGPIQQALALGESLWDAGHYAEGGGAPGSDLVKIIQLYNLTQYDQPNAGCAH